MPLCEFKNFKTLSIFDFIGCYVDGDYSSLVLGGTATSEQISAVWEAILFDYYDKIESEQGGRILELQSEILRKNRTLQFMVNVFSVYLISRDHRLKSILSKNGFEASGSDEDVVKLFEFWVKHKNIEIGNLGKDIKALIGESEQVKVTREVFFGNIVLLKKEGFALDVMKDSIEMYVVAMKMFKKKSK